MSRVALIAPAGVGPGHGVVDQARLAVRDLLDRGHSPSLHVVVSPGARAPNPAGDPVLEALESCTSLSGVWTALLQSPIDILWVHWANYGLSSLKPIGIPIGFVRRLRRCRNVSRNLEVVLSVHEGWDAHPLGPRWKRTRGEGQRVMLRRAVGLADRVSVNCDRWLHGLVGIEATKLPTYSNFPPPNGVALALERQGAVVMGSVEVRASLLAQMVDTDGWIGPSPSSSWRIHAIGQGELDGRQSVRGVPVIDHGFLPSAEVAAVVAGCAFGVIDIPEDVADKSSIAATYRELGLSTLNLATGRVREPESAGLSGARRTVEWALGD